jgi:SNF2 family DNA or RNA helicase
MPELFPHQREGALFLAANRTALLADAPRVGKTATAITACDYVLARKILVVTKASPRAQWGREFSTWGFPRNIQVIYKSTEKVSPDADVVIVGWGMVFNPDLWKQLVSRKWDVRILDESHEAKNPEAKRTKAVYNSRLKSDYTWCLSGTPVPNAPNDLYAMLVTLAPERLNKEPNVWHYNSFVKRYCIVKGRYINGMWREVIIGGKNEEELAERMRGFMLRRTQQDVGIKPPIYSVFPLHPDKMPKEALSDKDRADIMTAAEVGDTASLEIHLGTLRRITGELKANLVIQAVAEALEGGLDKVVLMHWHQEVGRLLRDGLSQYGVVGIDGTTPATKRDTEVQKFQSGDARVFVGQILAAGEGIDLSASAELWFVEPSFVPKDMGQAALRITNHSQKRQALVRVCALEGSIDEALMAILTRKVETINKIMEK